MCCPDVVLDSLKDVYGFLDWWNRQTGHVNGQWSMGPAKGSARSRNQVLAMVCKHVHDSLGWLQGEQRTHQEQRNRVAKAVGGWWWCGKKKAKDSMNAFMLTMDRSSCPLLEPPFQPVFGASTGIGPISAHPHNRIMILSLSGRNWEWRIPHPAVLRPHVSQCT